MSYQQYTTCPRCGSDNIHIITERDNKPYDLCGGLLGACCVGPWGLLCGFCTADGPHEKTTIVCHDCGAHFVR